METPNRAFIASGTVRPWTPLRYSAPSAFYHLRSSLSPAVQLITQLNLWNSIGEQAFTFRIRACTKLTPPKRRTLPGQQTGSDRAYPVGTSPGFDVVPTPSTRNRMIRSRSSSYLIPDEIRSLLFRNAQHSGSLPKDLAIV